MPPVVAAIVGAVKAVFAAIAGWSIGGFAIGSYLLQTAIGIGLNALLAPKQKSRVAERQADALQLTLGEGPREFVFGRAGLGGQLLNAWNYGGKHGTDWNVFAIKLADHPIDALESFYVSDELRTFTGDGAVSAYTVDGSEHLRVYFQRGDQTAPPTAITSNSGGKWTSAHVAKGCALVYIEYKANEKVWPQGRPRFVWNVRGARLYDPRKDSTVTGGSGSHRWANPATWEFSTNLYLGFCNWSWGIYDAGGKLIHGRGLTFDQFPAAARFAKLNLCDEDVPLKAGGTQDRYHGGGLVPSTQTFADTVDDFAACMGGEIVNRDGVVDIEPGAAKTVAVAIDEGDLLAFEPIRFVPHLDFDSRCNTAVARFTDPDQLWQDASAPMRRSAADIVSDKGYFEKTFDLPFTQNYITAQRIAEIRRRQARLERSFTIALGPRFIGLEVGDWITLTSTRYLGGSTVPFQIVGLQQEIGYESGRMRFRVALAIREVASSVYAWTAATDEIDKDQVLDLTPFRPTTASFAGLALTAISITGASGTTSPSIRVNWTGVTDPAYKAALIEYRVQGTTTVQQERSPSPAGGVHVLAGIIEPLTTYEVRIKPETDPQREETWTSWTAVTTGNNLVQDTSAVGGVPASEVLAGITAAVSDNVLTPGEKLLIVPQLQAILSAQAGLDGRAAAYQITTARSAYNAAVDALRSLLVGLTTPTAWDSLTGNTTVTGAILLAALRTALEAQTALQTEIDREAGRRSDVIIGERPAPHAALPGVDYLEANGRTWRLNTAGTGFVEVATIGARAGLNLRNAADTVTLGDGDIITSQGTAADTAAVGGTAAATVRDRAAQVAAAASGFADLTAAIADARARALWLNVNGRPVNLADLDGGASSDLAAARSEIAAARRGLSDLLASVSAAALSATWSQVIARPLTLADLDSAAATDLTNTRTELVAARGPAATVGARITAEETLRASEDAALAGRATTLEGAVFDGVTGLAATRARLTTEETTRANADSALATRATNLETEVTAARQGQASVSARLSQIDVARSDGDAALAGRATTLEARAETSEALAGTALNPNPIFASWPGSPTSSPTHWVAEASVSRTSEPIGRNGLSIAGPAGGDALAYTGWFRAAPGPHIIDVEAYLTSGPWSGAGVLVVCADASLAHLSYPRIQFDSDATTAGSVADGTLNRTRNWSVPFVAPAGTAHMTIYVFAHWQSGGFGSNAAANNVVFRRASVRPMSAVEATETGAQARITDEVAVRASADAALAGRATTLEAQMADTAGSGLRSRIANEEAVRASADTALAGRATTLEAQIGNAAASGLQARIANEEIARANADSALATRATTLEARARGAESIIALNINPHFADWPNPAGLPADWLWWGSDTGRSRVAGIGSPYALRLVTTTEINHGVGTAPWDGIINTLARGWYVICADITLESGSLVGAAAYFQWGPSTGSDNSTSINLAADPDTSGVAPGAGVAGRRYIYRKLVEIASPCERGAVFAMNGWADISPTAVAKTIVWQQCYVRAATLQEVQAQRAALTDIPTLTARIATEEAVRAAADSAEAVARTTLAAKLELTGNLFPDPNGSRGTAWGGSTFSRWASPRYGDTWLWERVVPVDDPDWRSAFYDIPVGPGTYMVSAYGTMSNNIPAYAFYVVAYDPAWNVLAVVSAPGFPQGADPFQRRILVNPINCPSGTTTLRIVAEWNLTGARGQYAFVALRQIQIEAGSVATVFNESGQNRAIAATVQQNSGAIATLNGATAWWQLLVNASGGLPAIFRLLSGQGGSEMLLAAARVVLANVDGTIVREALRLISGNVHVVNKLFVGASIELDPTAATISITAGSAKLVLGTGFGASSNLCLWFGPSMALSAMTTTNATLCLTTSGGGRFRDTLLVGDLSNARRTTELADDASIVIGPFTTNGAAKTVSVGYTARWDRDLPSTTAAASGSISASGPVERRLNGMGSWTSIGTWSASGTYTIVDDAEPGVPSTIDGTMSGSVTITDTAGSATDTIEYRARITSRTNIGHTPDAQELSILSVEAS